MKAEPFGGTSKELHIVTNRKGKEKKNLTLLTYQFLNFKWAILMCRDTHQKERNFNFGEEKTRETYRVSLYSVLFSVFRPVQEVHLTKNKSRRRLRKRKYKISRSLCRSKENMSFPLQFYLFP